MVPRPSRAPGSARPPSYHLPAPNHCGAVAHGCYRVVGPARISRRGDILVARLFRGSRVELLDRDGNAVHSTAHGSPYGDGSPIDGFVAAMGDEYEEEVGEEQEEEEGFGLDECDAEEADDDGCLGECVLVGAHVELGGSAASIDLVDLAVQPAVQHHLGHTYLSVRCLPERAVIELSADAALSHPINVTPECPDGL